MLFENIDDGVVVACSGGPDSMALLHFCTMRRKVDSVLHFEHGNTTFSRASRGLVEQFCQAQNLRLHVVPLPRGKTEAEWHEMRVEEYRKQSVTVVTGHTLDDALEWYLMTAFRGSPKFMPVDSNNVYRAMLATSRKDVRDYVDRHKVKCIDDPTNVGAFNDRAKLRVYFPRIDADFPHFRGMVLNHYRREYAERRKHGQG